MTEFEHALVGGTIIMILWLFIGKKHFESDKDVKSWEEWKDILKNNW